MSPYRTVPDGEKLEVIEFTRAILAACDPRHVQIDVDSRRITILNVPYEAIYHDPNRDVFGLRRLTK